ncbi:MAG: acyl-CoA thioesterase [Pelagibacteraceae bacterium TMED247]|nr:MAG: acyl-CoA thioesterase [Pelagibacteraceae bacterium TMED247]|tara:strand:+ start:8799 stop:9185 length:387 start_codon:yes stop_codon:yes gene_type:complete
MELISTHICKGQNIGVHGNLFGGVMLAWLDEAGGAYAAQCCDTPRMVTLKLSETVFKKPVRPGHLIKVYGEVLKVGTASVVIKLQARRHSPYNGTQKIVCETEITFVRVDGDGETIPISEKVKEKYKV